MFADTLPEWCPSWQPALHDGIAQRFSYLQSRPCAVAFRVAVGMLSVSYNAS